jgi:hypothetical protein
MVIYQSRHPVLHRYARDVDSLLRKPRLFRHEPGLDLTAFTIRICICAAVARILECVDLHDDELEGLPDVLYQQPVWRGKECAVRIQVAGTEERTRGWV